MPSRSASRTPSARRPTKPPDVRAARLPPSARRPLSRLSCSSGGRRTFDGCRRSGPASFARMRGTLSPSRDKSERVCEASCSTKQCECHECVYHPVMTFMRRLALGSPLLIVTTAVVAAQRPEPARALTAADYARAERFMNYNTTPLVLHSGVRPTWLPDGRFWYRTTTENGTAFFVVDPATGA